MEHGYYGATKGLNLNKANLRFAIGAFNLDREARNDPRYIKWVVRLRGRQDGVLTETVLSVHKCTQEDYD